MALNTVSSDRLSTNVKNTNFTSAEKQDLTDDILPLAGQLGNRNLIINGAMQVAQRGTSSTSTGFQTVDRFSIAFDSGLTEAPTQSQITLTSSDTPYSLGFRNAFRITNGNQTSQDANDYLLLRQKIEAQNIANSGWNYTSASSYVTLSFWVKVSVAQTMYVRLLAEDSPGGEQYSFAFSATTSWTKITKNIPGASGVIFNNDNGTGLNLHFIPFYGTSYTTSGHTNDVWEDQDGADQLPDMANTWFSANDATFDITGVQLEVGSVATDFEHRSFGQELALCQRYFYVHCEGLNKSIGNGTYWTANNVFCPVHFPVTMRSGPSMTVANDTINNWYAWFRNGGSNAEKGDNWSISIPGVNGCEIYDPAASGTAGQSCFGRTQDASAKISFSAEL